MYKRFALTLSLFCGTAMAGTSMVCAQMQMPMLDQMSTQTPGGDIRYQIRRAVMQQNHSGQVGKVTLYPRGDKTFVVLSLHGVPPGLVEPAHIHRGHGCSAIDPKPAFALHTVVNGLSETLVSAPIGRLLSGEYAVKVHQSSENVKRYVACGELTPVQATGAK